MPDSVKVISICLTAFQSAVYLVLIALSSYKLHLAYKLYNHFMQMFHTLALIYSIIQIIIQVFQLVTIIKGEKPENNSNIVLALNVFCMIIDVAIIAMLISYWTKIEKAFTNQVNLMNIRNSIKYFPILAWGLVYLGYFSYLVGSSNLTLSNSSLNSANKIILYIVTQSLSEFFLIIYSIIETYYWCRLEQMIDSFQKIMPSTINKKRFKAIFWAITVFNTLRSLVITYLVILANEGDYQTLIIALNCFTLSAIFPLVFYLFGFKIEQGENNLDLLRRESNSSKKRTDSSKSGRQTQLSHQSEKQNSEL